MCGFVGMFDIVENAESYRDTVIDMSRKIRHRGPDWSGVYTGEDAVISHERLSIVDPLSGKQPLFSKDGKLVLAANGEIYNHMEIRGKYKGKYEFLTMSDCEVILALYRDMGVDFLEELNGIFAFCLYDVEKDMYIVARDHIGIIPLYQGWDQDGHYFVASELKALEGTCTTVTEFMPGTVYCSATGETKKWYKRDWESFENIKDNGASVSEVREGLEAAVKRQMMSDVPYGVLLSGADEADQ